jgi:hypothetical protein
MSFSCPCEQILQSVLLSACVAPVALRLPVDAAHPALSAVGAQPQVHDAKRNQADNERAAGGVDMRPCPLSANDESTAEAILVLLGPKESAAPFRVELTYEVKRAAHAVSPCAGSRTHMRRSKAHSRHVGK